MTNRAKGTPAPWGVNGSAVWAERDGRRRMIAGFTYANDAERAVQCVNALQGVEAPDAICELIASALKVFGDAEDRDETRNRDPKYDEARMGELFPDWRALASSLVRVGMLDADVLEDRP